MLITRGKRVTSMKVSIGYNSLFKPFVQFNGLKKIEKLLQTTWFIVNIVRVSKNVKYEWNERLPEKFVMEFLIRR